jgi:hypothetical protein
MSPRPTVFVVDRLADDHDRDGRLLERFERDRLVLFALDLDVLHVRLETGRAADDFDVTRIDRQLGAPASFGEHAAVAHDLESLHADLARYDDREIRELGLEHVDVLLGELLAIGAAGLLGIEQRLTELAPRARDLAHLLVTDGEVEERARRGVEAIALGELLTGLGVAACLHEAAPREKERLGHRACFAARRRRGCGLVLGDPERRDGRDDERAGEERCDVSLH